MFAINMTVAACPFDRSAEDAAPQKPPCKRRGKIAAAFTDEASGVEKGYSDFSIALTLLLCEGVV